MCKAIDIQWVEDRDAVKHSRMPWTASETQSYLKLVIVSHFKTLGLAYTSVCISQNSLNGMLKTCISLYAIFSIKIEEPKPPIGSN